MNKSNISVTNIKKIKTEEILNYLGEGFLRGNICSLKPNTNEQFKGPTTIQHEIRTGVTHVSKKKKELFFKLIFIFRLMLN